jgi:hypothetical protein
MNGDRSFVDRENNFAFVCINNNNNTVVEEPQPELVTCEDCFRQNLNTAEFEDLEETLANGLQIVVGGEFIIVNSLEDLCEALEAATTTFEIAQVVFFVLFATNPDVIPDDTTIFNIALCIADVLGIRL